jgi:hypothetical protein
MSFNSNIGADNYLNFTIGTAAALGNGSYTIAVLVKPTIGNNNCGLVQLRNGGSGVRTFLEDGNQLFGENAFAGFGALTQGNWYLCIIKAENAAAYAYDLWAYAADGSGSMSHGDSAFSASAGSACDGMRLGWGIDRGNGDFAVIGLWDRKISNAEADTLKTNLLSKYADLTPKELITFDEWDGTVGSENVKIGTSSCALITGTVGAAADPPSFDFALVTIIDLVTADAGQAQAAGALTLTQAHNLAVGNADQSQSAGNVVLSQTHILGIQSALQAQTATDLGSLVPAADTVAGGVVAATNLIGSVASTAVALAGTIE